MSPDRRPPDDDETLVTLRTYFNPMEAEWAQALLTSANICSLIPDRSLAYLYNFVGGIRLQVPAHKAEAAEAVLSEHEFQQRPLSEFPREGDSSEQDLGGEAEPQEVPEALGPEDVCPLPAPAVCPQCGAEGAAPVPAPPYAAESRLGEFLGRAFGHLWLRCESCGNVWRT